MIKKNALFRKRVRKYHKWLFSKIMNFYVDEVLMKGTGIKKVKWTKRGK